MNLELCHTGLYNQQLFSRVVLEMVINTVPGTRKATLFLCQCGATDIITETRTDFTFFKFGWFLLYIVEGIYICNHYNCLRSPFVLATDPTLLIYPPASHTVSACQL